MPNKFCVSYDLIDRKDYSRLITELKRRGAHRALESVWFIEFDGETPALLGELARFIDNDDQLVVIRMQYPPRTLRAKGGTSAWLDLRFGR